VIPDTLMESELFGHARGSFTGAIGDTLGLFREADGGTLFLDEIGDISPLFQTKLLRVLQEREVKPVGSSKTHRVDVRLITATHVNLDDARKDGRFREDLYYRLAVIPIWIPPLRGRVSDIPLLATHFLDQCCRVNNLGPRAFGPGTLDRMAAYPWPGNVRELQNVIERTALTTRETTIRPQDLPPEIARSKSAATPAALLRGSSLPSAPPGSADTPQTLARAVQPASDVLARDAIVKALKKARGNMSKAANSLGISRASL
jgi:transcriptional regulator with GAF, ATPase, and Fis domain